MQRGGFKIHDELAGERFDGRAVAARSTDHDLVAGDGDVQGGERSDRSA